MRTALASALALVVLLAAASAAWALQRPGRSVVRGGPIVSVGLTGRAIGFGVGRTPRDCDHVELWNTATRGLWRLGRARPCGDLPIFSGIGQIGVASKRVVWVTYAGGNLTDWQLWTATPTRKTPRRLAFVERETGDPAPVVVGDGTSQAVPYAVEKTVTWLGDDGSALFKWTAPSDVRAVTSGNGRLGWRVAALLASGDVAVLNGTGDLDSTLTFPPGAVKWLALAPAGLFVQLPGAKVEIHGGSATRTVQLPRNAIVLDVADGRILYRVGQRYALRTIGTGADLPVLQGSKKHPLVAALDTGGLAWAQGTRLNWACAACLSST